MKPTQQTHPQQGKNHEPPAPRLQKRIILKGILTVKTGLHIGAGRDAAKIGGLDNPVVRAVLMGNQPYIPGSSLKGKIRSLLELMHGIDCTSRNNSSRHPKGEDGTCPICKVFGGTIANEKNHASRVIFRDAYLTQDSKKKLEDVDTDYPYTEVKNETAIDRITGCAKRGFFRQTERIPAGTQFCVEIVVNVFDPNSGVNEPTEDEIRNLLLEGIRLLNTDYLGGSGSRGYGQVELKFYEVEIYDVEKRTVEKRTEENGSESYKFQWKEQLKKKGLWTEEKPRCQCVPLPDPNTDPEKSSSE